MVILKIQPDEECPICLRPFLVKGATQGKAMTGGKCEHAFCRPCFRKWWSMNPSCPVCRESLIIDQPILVVPIPPKPLIDLRPIRSELIRRRLIDTVEWRKDVVLPLRPLIPKKIRTFALLDVYDGTPCSPSIVELSLIPLTPIVVPLAPFNELFVDEEIVLERIRDRKRKTKKPAVCDDLLLPIKMPRKRTATSKNNCRAQKRAKREKEESSRVYVRADDGPKNLETLPQLPFDLICSFLTADGDFDDLGSLRKVSSRCMRAVESFLGSAENIPPVDSIIFTDMDKYDRSSFTLELLILKKWLGMNVKISALYSRITQVEIIGELVRLRIAVRNRKDKVIEYIQDVLSPRIENLEIGNLRNLEELHFIQRLIGKRKIEKLYLRVDYFLILERSLSSELISFMKNLSITTVDYKDVFHAVPSSISLNFINGLVQTAKEGKFWGLGRTPFDLAPSVWMNIEQSIKRTHAHARFYEMEETQYDAKKRIIFEWKK